MIIGTQASPSPFIVSSAGSEYQAVSQGTGGSFTGSLKFVVENAVAELNAAGGGVVRFTNGDFNLGGDWFELYDMAGITFRRRWNRLHHDPQRF